MRHVDLFTGIGGFPFAAAHIFPNYVPVCFCEIDPWCRELLKLRFPGVPIAEDVKILQGSDFGTVDIISGGFPCQSHSLAGKRRGRADTRWLWPEMCRIIRQAKPRWVVAENVPGLFSSDRGMAIEQVFHDLEDSGYSTLPPLQIPACGCGAPQERSRVWIVGLANGSRFSGDNRRQSGQIITGRCAHVADGPRLGMEGSRPDWKQITQSHAQPPISFCACSGSVPGQWAVEPQLGRVAHGISGRVDRIRSLGNAIVPQVAMMLFETIRKVDEYYAITAAQS